MKLKSITLLTDMLVGSTIYNWELLKKT